MLKEIQRQFIKRRTAFLIIAPLLFLVLIEFTVRLGSHFYWKYRYASMAQQADHAKLQYDRDRGWAWEEGQKFRGRDRVEKEKPKDLYRIIVIGDSCTRGSGVHPMEAYSWRLQEKLEETKLPLRVEVLNAGVNGYSTGQMADYLEKDLLGYSPDLVIVYANPFDRDDTAIDPDRKIDEKEWLRRRVEAEPSPYVEAIQKFLFRFKSYYLLKQWILSVREAPRTPLYQTDLRRSSNLTRMRDLCDRAGAEMMIVEYVVKKYEGGPDFLAAPDANPRRNWEATFIPIFSVMTESGYSPNDLFNDAVHPTALGHNLIAAEIAKEILSLDLIGKEAASRGGG